LIARFKPLSHKVILLATENISTNLVLGVKPFLGDNFLII